MQRVEALPRGWITQSAVRRNISNFQFLGRNKSGKMKETLHGFTVDGYNVILSVTSSGCTSSEHFVLYAEEIDGDKDAVKILAIRTTPDDCKMVDHIVDVVVELPKMAGKKRLVVANEFSPGPSRLAPGDKPEAR